MASLSDTSFSQMNFVAYVFCLHHYLTQVPYVA